MRRSNTQKLSDVLKDYLQENKLERKFTELDVVASWEKLLGQTVARYTESLHIQNGTLFVKTSSPALRNELIMMKEEIRRRLNEKAGQELIRQIVFK